MTVSKRKKDSQAANFAIFKMRGIAGNTSHLYYNMTERWMIDELALRDWTPEDHASLSTELKALMIHANRAVAILDYVKDKIKIETELNAMDKLSDAEVRAEFSKLAAESPE
jgi:hypothetical protein